MPGLLKCVYLSRKNDVYYVQSPPLGPNRQRTRNNCKCSRSCLLSQQPQQRPPSLCQESPATIGQRLSRRSETSHPRRAVLQPCFAASATPRIAGYQATQVDLSQGLPCIMLMASLPTNHALLRFSERWNPGSTLASLRECCEGRQGGHGHGCDVPDDQR